jgi:hypothetical protein
LLAAASCGGSQTKTASTETTGGNTSTAPSGQAAANQKAALVRFVNAQPGQNATLSFGGQTAFSNIAYGTVTGYQELPANNNNFELFTAAGQNAPPAATESKGLSAGDHYTVVAALDDNAKPKLEIIDDNLGIPSNGKAKVRVINASADRIDVIAPERGNKGRVKANKLFSGVSEASSANFKNIDPLQGTLEVERSLSRGQVNPSGGSQPKHVARQVPVPANFRSGNDYTIIVMGGTAQYPLKAAVVEDQLNGGARPVG